MAFSLRVLGLAAMFGVAMSAAVAQQANIAFGGLKQDTTLPVKVEADQLAVNTADGTAQFTGNVLVSQGELRMAAAVVKVKYGADGKSIDQLLASGGVTISNLADAAEAREALYTIGSGVVVMTGDVLLTQGASAIAGQKLTIDLKSGAGTMEGRVSTTFTPGQN